MAVQPDDRKLAELILFIARESATDRNMGAVKLNKVLYHCDFDAYLELGEPITGHPYRKLREGPVPRFLPVVRDELVDRGDAHLEATDIGMANPFIRVVADRDPDLSVFTEAELGVVRRVLARMRGMTGTQASDETHQLVSWIVGEMGEDIPYETAHLGRATRSDIMRGLELAKLHGWT